METRRRCRDITHTIYCLPLKYYLDIFNCDYRKSCFYTWLVRKLCKRKDPLLELNPNYASNTFTDYTVADVNRSTVAKCPARTGSHNIQETERHRMSATTVMAVDRRHSRTPYVKVNLTDKENTILMRNIYAKDIL